MIVGVAFPWTLERLLPSGSAFLSFEVGFVSDMIRKEAFWRKACECSELFIEALCTLKWFSSSIRADTFRLILEGRETNNYDR